MSDLKQTMRDSAAKQLMYTAKAAKTRADWATHRAARFRKEYREPMPDSARNDLEEAHKMITAVLKADDELRNAA